MSKRPDLGVDAGSVLTRVALAGQGRETLITSHESGPDGRKATLAAALRDAAKDGGQEPGRICVAVPDSWLDGEIAGAQEHEAMRAVIESGQPSERVLWVGQLSAVAAIAATRPGQGSQDLYLVCDAGGAGVRAGLFTVCDRAVRTVKIAEASGG